jgi:hypothetical protein
MNFAKYLGEQYAGESSACLWQNLRFRWFGIYQGILSVIVTAQCDLHHGRHVHPVLRCEVTLEVCPALSKVQSGTVPLA